jgi:branched-chain amino acid transport system substrate-binding protein
MIILVTALTAFLLNAGTPVQAQSKPDILIGILNDLSGPAAAPGKSFQAGIEDALLWLNGKGGIMGHPVKTVTVDTRFEVPLSLQGYQKLVKQDKVKAIVVLATVAGIVNKKNINKDKMPTIMAADMGTLLPFKGSSIFAGIPHNSQRGAGGLVWIKNTWKKSSPPKIGLHHWESSSGYEFSRAMQFWMKTMGMGKPAITTSAKMGTVDYTTQIIKLKDANLDYLFSYDIALGLFKDIARLGLKDKTKVIDLAALSNEMLPEVLGDAAKGIYNISEYANWFEEDVPGIKLMRDMNAKTHPKVRRRGDWYILGWTAALTFQQTFESVLKTAGFQGLTGENIVKALENTPIETMGITGAPIKRSPDNHLCLDVKARVLRHEGMGRFTPESGWVGLPNWPAETLNIKWWKKK